VNESNPLVRKKRSPRLDTVKRPNDNNGLTYNSLRHKIGTLGDHAPVTYAMELSARWLRVPIR
jgi:hypothetical protein